MEDTDVRRDSTGQEVTDTMRVKVAFEIGPIERVVGVLDDNIDLSR